MGQINGGVTRHASEEEINYFWHLDKKRPYLFGKNIDEEKFTACFAADETEYFGRQVSNANLRNFVQIFFSNLAAYLNREIRRELRQKVG